MKRLCTICARGGSKGVKNKNLLPIVGIPLIGISIKQAKLTGLFDYIAVSSDSDEILNVAQKHGVDILIKRPDELASDTSGKLPAIQHCAAEVEKRLNTQFQTYVDLDTTSPLRLVSDIKGAVELLENSHCSNVITGMPARRSPYFNLVEEKIDGFVTLAKTPEKPILRRQDAPQCFDMNASIYAWNRRTLFEGTKLFFKDTKLFTMPEERSIDIDSELDFEFVSFIAKKHKRFLNEW